MSQRRVMEQDPATVVRGLPETEVEREAVREQLERILAHPLFSHSKRYPLLLRWVVEKALEGRAGQLKERTLGVEVFSRDPDYDTNTDPVVRITAGEIRKRIAQYYHEPGRETELRIDLPCGTYVPEFHRPAALLLPDPPALVPPALEVLPQVPPRPRASRRPFSPVYLTALALPPVVWLAIWVFSITSIDRFWQPFWDTPGTPLLF